jgi:hypothetical protein
MTNKFKENARIQKKEKELLQPEGNKMYKENTHRRERQE